MVNLCLPTPDDFGLQLAGLLLDIHRQNLAGISNPRRDALAHSHSIVAGGFPEMSYTTRETPGTSFTIRRET